MGLIIGKENVFSTEELIYQIGDAIESVSCVVEGSVMMKNDTDDVIIGAGNFIAVRDLCNGYYMDEYYALPGSKIMTFPVSSLEGLVDFFTSNPLLHQKYYHHICSIMQCLYEQYQALYSEISELFTFTRDAHQRYVQCCEMISQPAAQIMMPHSAGLFKYEEQSFTQNYNIFLACLRAPEKMTIIYNKNPENFMKQQLNMISSLYTTYEDMLFYLKTEISVLAGKGDNCLYSLTSSLMDHVTRSQSFYIVDLLKDINDTLTSVDSSLRQTLGIKTDIDFARINNLYAQALSVTPKHDVMEAVQGDDSQDEEDFQDFSDFASLADLLDFDEPSDETFDDELSDINLDGIMLNLCEYAQKDSQFHAKLNGLIDFYVGLSDKGSRDDDARAFRRDMTNMFFELYEDVFFRYVEDDKAPAFVKIFLDFGLLDDRLVTDEQLQILADIRPLMRSNPCKVWRMSDWLSAIYREEKMPSKNEFDKDYTEFVRDKKREEHLTPQQEAQMLSDAKAKVRFEINNVLKYNCRILSGNMLGFTPMLSKFDIEGDFSSFILTSDRVNDAVKNCIEIDYSAFYREQMYTNPEKKIDKEVIQLEVFPDIVLFPVYGINGVMWQDLSGKRSNTPGRFFLPSFFRGNLNDTMISLIGRFRWELCKSIMGTAWNNVIVPSLTAEYSDYIQFYRKNRDLSAEKKEALKNQLSRCRNNMREVFISDYSTWIKFESNGAIRLNKVSRQILATYCPFNKTLRAKVAGQPLYDEALRKFNANQQKKAHEMVTRIRNLERVGAEITEEILKTQAFYDL